MKIPYHKPYPLSQKNRENINMGINTCLRTGQLTNGVFVRKLESHVQDYYDVSHAIAVSSCTQGLLLCLLVLDKRPKEVNTPAFGWYSSKWAIEAIGATPIYHDIGQYTWVMENYDFNREDVLMPVHTFGNVAACDGGHVIYDGAHALGACLYDVIGDATVFSLAPTKLITACEGGIIITNNDAMAAKLIEMRDKVSRMSELNALMGLETLKSLNGILLWKDQVKEYYEANIPGTFQAKCIDHNWNTVGFLNTKNLKIPAHIEVKRYYEPLSKLVPPTTQMIYDDIVCLPSWYGVDYKKIVEDILA